MNKDVGPLKHFVLLSYLMHGCIYYYFKIFYLFIYLLFYVWKRFSIIVCWHLRQANIDGIACLYMEALLPLPNLGIKKFQLYRKIKKCTPKDQSP
jgi:hypothetical protein